eukprot:GHVS01041159.1.p2 GENE.GHVS01041159.1~~GHVS01041159.1.p2  ORF type:complete len:220 (-),score=56.18 GHVS01041159.1:585-1244(-)
MMSPSPSSSHHTATTTTTTHHTALSPTVNVFSVDYFSSLRPLQPENFLTSCIRLLKDTHPSLVIIDDQPLSLSTSYSPTILIQPPTTSTSSCSSQTRPTPIPASTSSSLPTDILSGSGLTCCLPRAPPSRMSPSTSLPHPDHLHTADPPDGDGTSSSCFSFLPYPSQLPLLPHHQTGRCLSSLLTEVQCRRHRSNREPLVCARRLLLPLQLTKMKKMEE